MLGMPHARIERPCARLARRLRSSRASVRRPHRERRRGLSARFDPAARQGHRRRLRADHAELCGRRQRERPRQARGLSQIPVDGAEPARSAAMTEMTLPFAPAAAADGESYLGEGHTIMSWLTTTDHKRIAILYALSI